MSAQANLVKVVPLQESFKEHIAALGAFSAHDTRWNEHNALALAYASDLAYKTPDVIRQVGPLCGFPRVSVIAVREVQAIVLGGETGIILAFRGTRPDQLLDWVTDAYATQAPFGACFQGPTVGGTHQGFTLALLRVWPQILRDVAAFQDKAQPLWITGHSLGGALAALAAAAFTFVQRMPVNGLHTFGQPRVGDLTFTALLDGHLGGVYYRFVNDEDIVTRIPPRVIPLPPTFYAHAGQTMYFDGSGVLHTSESWWNSFLLRIDVGVGGMKRLLTEQVGDHDLLGGYAANLAAFVAGSRPDQKKPLVF